VPPQMDSPKTCDYACYLVIEKFTKESPTSPLPLACLSPLTATCTPQYTNNLAFTAE
jgi:hypothetical protein